VLRPLANIKYIEQYEKMPYIEYYRTLDAIDMDRTVLDEILNLAKLKEVVDESHLVPQNELLMKYFFNEIARQKSGLMI